MNQNQFITSMDSCRRWLCDHITYNGAALNGYAEVSTMPTCFAVLARECLAFKFSGKEDAAITAILQSQQDDEGWFHPEELKRKDLSSHSATYIRMQSTYFAIHALDALGARPTMPIRFVEKLRDTSYLEGWLDGGPWRNPWLHSNNIMFALCFLHLDGFENGNEKSVAAFDFILDYLDARQDPETGLWQPDDEVDIPNAVFAAYHFFPYYYWRGRAVRHSERIIDSVLSIQKPDGLFINGGGACEDLDAVHTLVMMNLVTDHRADDVKRSLERCFWRLLQIQNSDGGFPNSVFNPGKASWKRRLLEKTGLLRFLPEQHRNRGLPYAPNWHYSGWKKLGCAVGASDMWSAWFRPLSLRLIAETIDGIEPTELGGYRRLPGLGWHDASRIAACAVEVPHDSSHTESILAK